VIENRTIDQFLVKTLLTTLLESDGDESWIGVDLDGTLAKHTEWKGSKHIGEPIPLMVARVRRWLNDGKNVKIFTARADDEVSVNAIKAWLKEHDLPDLEITNLKDRHMTKMWDDRAVAVEKNTGEVKEHLDREDWESLRLFESPEIETLKKNQRPLDPEERAQVMKAGAVWHMGKDGAASPAVRKAVVNGKTWYWCATHRAGQVRSTLKAAIKAFAFIETTA
jgi:hypothetical protein